MNALRARTTPARCAAAIVLGAVVVLATSCSAGSGDQPLRVLAASSLTEAFAEAGEAFAATPDGVPVEASFAGSQTLVTQLAEGVEADVLATADTTSMDGATAQDLVRAPTVFATNTLVLVTPSDNPGGISTPADIAKPGVRLVLAAEEVPVGRYARDALQQLDLTAALGNVVSEEEDVKGVLGKVASSEADAGIVYRTDVTDDVTAIDLDVPDIIASYPIAVTKNAYDPDAARRFVDFLVSGDGAAILREHGFGTASSS